MSPSVVFTGSRAISPARDLWLCVPGSHRVCPFQLSNVHVAFRHLEQVTWATIVASNIKRPELKREWIDLMESLSQRSLQSYRELVEQPGFIEFFEASTPIEEIENLPIASRPSRRTSWCCSTTTASWRMTCCVRTSPDRMKRTSGRFPRRDCVAG